MLQEVIGVGRLDQRVRSGITRRSVLRIYLKVPPFPALPITSSTVSIYVPDERGRFPGESGDCYNLSGQGCTSSRLMFLR